MTRTVYSFLFSTCVLLLCSCSDRGDVIRPAYMDLTEVVYASGNVYPKNEYKVSANADGFMVERKVDPGDRIDSGMLMFRIESEVQDVRSEAAGKVYEKARENYGSGSPAIMEATVAYKNAYEKFRLDSLNYIRYKTLYENSSTSKAEFDRITLAYTVSGNEYRQLGDALKKLKNQLYIELQNAEASYKSSRKDAGDALVTSNIKGLVYDVSKEQGEMVRRNETIAIIGDAENIYLKLVVDELDIEKIRPGQEVFVKLDIEPEKSYKAKVSKIYPKLNREDQSFRVDAAFSGEKPASLYGVTVEANILISEKKHVLTLPKSVVQKGDSIWVKRGGEKVKEKLQKGVESFDYVEVAGGVTENDEVFLK